MAGINLSQSLQEKQAQARGRFFGLSFFLIIGGFVFLLGVFGGIRWYVASLEKKMQAMEQSIVEKTASLRGKEVNRVADFVRRIGIIKEHLRTEPDPVVTFRQLEMYTLPTVRLTTYKYDRTTNVTTLGGEANTLKEVAQQMLAFKNIEGTERITVERIEYDEAGKVVFSFVLTQSQVLARGVTLP